MWRLELPAEIAPFDFEGISAVILQMRYTAPEAGQLSDAAVDHLRDEVLGDHENLLLQLSCLNPDFGDAWHAFAAAASDDARRLTLGVRTDHFPYWVKSLGMDDV